MPSAQVEVRYRDIFSPLFADPARFTVVVAHRRSGKTVASVQKLVMSALGATEPRARYAFIAPLRIQAKQVAWDYAKSMVERIPGTKVSESELRIDLPNAARVQLFGSDNPDALRGNYLDGCVLDEYAQMPANTWDEVVRPMLSDRKGWAVFIGTPMGANAFKDLYDNAAVLPGWARYLYRASQTGLVDEDELESARLAMSAEAYEQEYECSWTAAVKGAYYGILMEDAEREGRVTEVPYDYALPTFSAWDLGVRDATAIWVIQVHPTHYRVIDYLESSGVGLDWYANELDAKPYRWAGHIAPHDIAVKELGTGRSRLEVARDLGLAFSVAKRHRVPDGIQAVRSILPRMWFDAKKCARGIRALQLYRQNFNHQLNAFSASPLHDWTSHGADAMRTFAMADHSAADDEWLDPGVSPNTGRRYEPVRRFA